VASEYQKTRIEAIGERLGFRTYSPLWHKNQRQLLEDINNAGFKAIIVGIAAEGFDESWLGRQINKETIEELERLHKKYGINMTGEGGEYETFITDGPTFKKKVEIQHLKKKMQNRNTGTLEIRKAMLKNASAT
jgi:predicted ATP pyrophosphatase (TIGR00289 family)